MGSKDKLEKFVVDNRHDFGPDEGFPDVWAGVKKREAPDSANSDVVRLWLTRAASVAIIFSLAYAFFWLTNKPGSIDSVDDPFSLAMSELMEADDYYSAIITERKSELFELTQNSPSIRDDVDRDFADLDAILIELRVDLQDNADNAEVIEAMMQHYRLKLEILEDMLEQVKMNKSKNQNEKGVSI
jgi:hypothetical protein